MWSPIALTTYREFRGGRMDAGVEGVLALGRAIQRAQHNAGAASGRAEPAALIVLAEVLDNHFNHSCTSYHNPCFQELGIIQWNGAYGFSDKSKHWASSQRGNNSSATFPEILSRGPHFSDVDMTLFKDVYKKESLRSRSARRHTTLSIM